MQRLKIGKPHQDLGTPNPKIQTIRFRNVSKNWLFKVYPEGETALWDCRVSGYDKCFVDVVFKNMGDAGNVWLGILVGNSAYWWWLGYLGANEEKAVSYLTGSGYAPSYTARAMDATVSPYRTTDSVSFAPEALTGFRVFAYEDSTRVVATGKIVETNQTFQVDAITENIVHVGAENSGKTYTVECTRNNRTLSQQGTASSSLPRLEFWFGAHIYPNLRIDKIVFWDTPNGSRSSYKVFPEGEMALFSPAGATWAEVTVTNTGGDGYYMVLCNGVGAGEPINAGETKTIITPPVGSPHYDNIMHVAVVSGYVLQPTPPWQMIETDRKEFDAYRSMPITTYPSPNPDAWCDIILADEGMWLNPGPPSPPGVVRIDSDRVYGQYSIMYSSGKAENSGKCTFALDAGMEANGNNFPWLHLLLKLGQNCRGPFRIILEDAAGQKVWFASITPLDSWQTFMIPVGSENDALWNKDPQNTMAFDWSSVKRISIEVEFAPNTIGIYRIDNMHFTTVVPGRRSIYVYVYEKGQVTKPLANMNVIHGLFSGLDPNTGQEKYFWDYSHINKTGSNGKTNFTELLPLVYGIRVEDPSGKYKNAEVWRVDVRSADMNVNVPLELKPITKPEDVAKAVLLIAGVFTTVIVLSQA